MIERELSGGILTLRLAHGKASAMDTELIRAMLGELGRLDGARAVVLTGTGSIFSAGVDLVRLTAGGAEYVREFLPLLDEVLRALFTLPVPLVAAVNGHAIAGGCLMAMAADYAVMAEGGGRIGVPELLVGVALPAAPLEVVRYAVPARAQALVYSGRTLKPAEALEWGVVHEVVERARLVERAREVAEQMARVAPEAFRLAKESLRAEALERMDRTAARTDERVLAVWQAPETHERIRAYLASVVRK